MIIEDTLEKLDVKYTSKRNDAFNSLTKFNVWRHLQYRIYISKCFRRDSRNWSGIASSSDGTKLIAGEIYGGNLWTSTDSGVTWVDQVATGNGYWHAVASSSDGTHLVAGDGYNAGDVWTGVLIS